MFTATDDTLVWQDVQRARANLYDYLLTLKIIDWDKQSLCQGWRVRDVVAHLIILYQYSPKQSATKFIKNRLSFNAFLRQTAIEFGDKDIPELLSEFKTIVRHQKLPFFVPVLNVLVDTLIHEQDIRIPLSDERTMPLDALKLVFAHWQPGNFNIGEKITGIKKRTHGLQFKATDMDATYGAGLIVSGRAEDLLLTMTGRTARLAQLNGPGVAVLKARLT